MTTTSNARTGVPARSRSASDLDLLAGIARGDRHAFEMLYDRHAAAVHAYSRTHTLTGEDAEEITQEVFLTLWSKRRDVTVVGESVLPWLMVTCKNKTLNKRRSDIVEGRRRSDTPVDETHPSTALGPEQVAEYRELAGVIASAVERLSNIDRLIFRTCVVDGQPYETAAVSIGVSHGVVRNRLSRLRARLRDEIMTLKGRP